MNSYLIFIHYSIVRCLAKNSSLASTSTVKDGRCGGKSLDNIIKQLESYGIDTKLVRRVHSKIVIGDDNLLCIGSFNWFSASREAQYERYDTSMVYYGEYLEKEVKVIYKNLEQRYYS